LWESSSTASTLSARSPSTSFWSSCSWPCPIRDKAFGVRDRHVREGLTDNADAEAAEHPDHGRLEYPAGRRIERRRVVEHRLLGQEDILGEKLALELGQIAPQCLLAVGELPMSRHRLDAEEIARLHHVLAAHQVRQAAALPKVAAVEHDGTLWAGIGAQTIDQGLQVREATERAEAARGFLEIQKREGMSTPSSGCDAEMFEKSLPDKMRRGSCATADSNVDAWLAEMDRQELRVGISQVQHAYVAEALDIVEAFIRFSRSGGPGQRAGGCHRAHRPQEVSAAEHC
jgi:hypothetical protein